MKINKHKMTTRNVKFNRQCSPSINTGNELSIIIVHYDQRFIGVDSLVRRELTRPGRPLSAFACGDPLDMSGPRRREKTQSIGEYLTVISATAVRHCISQSHRIDIVLLFHHNSLCARSFVRWVSTFRCTSWMTSRAPTSSHITRFTRHLQIEPLNVTQFLCFLLFGWRIGRLTADGVRVQYAIYMRNDAHTMPRHIIA